MKKAEYPYLDMYYQDKSYISVENWHDSWSVDMHRHDYYELMVVNYGSCRHMFHGVETLLIPGDAVFIPRHEAHGYWLGGKISLYNCQFWTECLDSCIVRMLAEEGVLPPATQTPETKDSYWVMAGREDMHAEALPKYEANSTKQGVLHLSPSELTFIVSLLERIVEEQKADAPNSALLKQKYLEVILLEIKKTVNYQNRKYIACSAGNQKIIARILAEMEENLTEPFNITEVARQYAFSPNYLRKLFKDFTGLSPIQYINRLRMIRACEYMGLLGMRTKEAAEKVGIYDLNYFARLFKKFIGYSPNEKYR